MQEQRQEQIARYLSGYISSHSMKSLTTWITYGVGYFDALGVTWPNDSDYQGLRAEMLGTLPGVKKGTVISSGQADKRVAETRKFYEWLKQQEGETKQMSLFEETEAGGIEPEGAGMAQQGDIEPVSSEGVAECADHGASVQEVTTEEKDTAALSPVDTHSNEAVPVQEATIAPKPKNKGGRKILDPNGEKRSEKVMIYLRPSLYVDVKDWANLHGKTITDCIVGMIEGYMQGKQEKLTIFRELRDNE